MPQAKRPVRPGEFVRAEILDPLGLTVTEAAAVLGVARPTLSALLNGHASLTPEMGLRIEKAFGVKMDMLVEMQTAYDIAEARAREDEIDVKPYPGKPKPPQPRLFEDSPVTTGRRQRG